MGIVIKALTDNRNRTAPNMRHAFAKCGGTLGETGSVSGFAFKFLGEFEISGPLTDALEEVIMESGASDYLVEGEIVKITCHWSDFAKVREYLLSKGLELSLAE